MSGHKVAVLSACNIPSKRAHTFSVMKMAQGFAGLGFDTEVVTADSVRQRIMGKVTPDLYAHYGLSNKVPVRKIPPSLKAFLTGRINHDYVHSLRVAQYVVEHKFDWVYCRSYLIPYFTARAGVPTVVDTHTTDYSHPALQKIYEVANLPAFKGISTAHEAIKAEHVKRGVPSGKIIALENGVDLERFAIADAATYWKRELALDPDKQYVVYSGHLYPDKGIDMIVAAADRLRHRKNLVFLLVGGFKKWRRFWERRCRKHRISNVLFTGFVANAQVPKYLKAADCLLLPYRLDMDHKVMDIHTTSPIKLFEYMAARRAIVASGIPTVKKVLCHGRNALLAPPGDVDALCHLIKEILDTPELDQGLRETAYRDVQQYTWESRCRAIIQNLVCA